MIEQEHRKIFLEFNLGYDELSRLVIKLHCIACHYCVTPHHCHIWNKVKKLILPLVPMWIKLQLKKMQSGYSNGINTLFVYRLLQLLSWFQEHGRMFRGAYEEILIYFNCLHYGEAIWIVFDGMQL